MKVYALPDHLHFKDPDFSDYNHEVEMVREESHRNEVREWMRSEGYNGEHTGKIARFPVADGFAEYMLADNGDDSFLIHLPYGDGWNYRDIEFLPREEILKRVEQQEKIDALFAAAKE